MNIQEIERICKEEELNINLFNSTYDRGNKAWCAVFTRSNAAGEFRLTLYGPSIEELLTRGIESATGIAIHGPALSAPQQSYPAPTFADDIPF